MREEVIGEASVIPLFGGNDPRCGELIAAILDVIYERGKGLPFVSVLGTLRLAENELIKQHRENN